MKALILIIWFSLCSASVASTMEKVEKALTEQDIALAKTEYSALPDDVKQTLPAKIAKGRLLLSNEDGEPAFDYFEVLQEQHASNAQVNYYFSVSAIIMAQQASIFSKLGYAEDFVESIEKTLTLKPNYIEALDTAIGFYLHAPGIAGGDIDKATQYAKKLLTIAPVKGYKHLATIYRANEKPQEAYKTLAEGLVKYPESSELYFYRAITSMDDKAWQKAREDFKLAVKFAQNDEEKTKALYQQGKLAAETGEEVEVGIHALQNSQVKNSKQYEKWSQLRLAQLYMHQKKYDIAEKTLTSIELNDEEKLADKVKELKKKIKKLKS
ncbi:lipopolysaccharide assembly protein LapB [Thalassotalea sp. PP2-459]|uniref:tetratricopeptide repeat protein n=1 Tax=Thalassotalea sp. PP2-459 TaxID=1742724 RepID=UPI00094457C9|nr:hypothetical protein [Thalassotalea sp. PP2-459]OKY24820.1 hypothetical protein BI291_04465 [Thalassotalea sp. PP2-459]